MKKQRTSLMLTIILLILCLDGALANEAICYNQLTTTPGIAYKLETIENQYNNPNRKRYKIAIEDGQEISLTIKKATILGSILSSDYKNKEIYIADFVCYSNYSQFIIEESEIDLFLNFLQAIKREMFTEGRKDLKIYYKAIDGTQYSSDYAMKGPFLKIQFDEDHYLQIFEESAIDGLNEMLENFKEIVQR